MSLARDNEQLPSYAMRQTSAAVNSSNDTLFPLGGRWFFVVVLASTLGAEGCGGSNGDDIAPVHGIITLDGKPVTEGFVFVTPAAGKMAKGAIQSDGTFVLGTNSNSDGAKTGTHPVSVQPPPAREGMPPSAAAKAIPQHYRKASTSGLTVDVKPGADNELKIELSTR